MNISIINRLISVAVATFCLLSLASCGVNTSPGNGEKVGTIVRVSKVGMANDTWEGELIRGGMSNGSGSFGAVPFHFTIEKDDMAKLAEKYMREGTEVTIKYRQEGVWSVTRSESGGTFLETIVPQKDSAIPVKR